MTATMDALAAVPMFRDLPKKSLERIEKFARQRSFQAGVRTTLDVLNAQQQLATARRDLSQARYTALLSQVRLQALAGVFDEARLARLNDWLQR